MGGKKERLRVLIVDLKAAIELAEVATFICACSKFRQPWDSEDVNGNSDLFMLNASNNNQTQICIMIPEHTRQS